MNKILDDYLYNKYPKIFAERKLSPQESCLGRGFECGNGWMPLIDSLCYNIQQHIDSHNEWVEKYGKKKDKLIPQFVALQVKEKFGSLRIYHQGGDDYCQGLVDMAVSWSWNTCEICGDGGKRLVGHTKGWIGSICVDCSKRIKKPITFDKEVKPMLLKAVREDLKRYV